MEQIVQCNYCGEPEHIARYEGFACLDENCPGTYEFLPHITEMWRDIPGWEGYYQASNMGRIKGLTRTVQVGPNLQTIKERVIYGSVSQDGYLSMKLCRDAEAQFVLIARLIYEVWMGPIGEMTVDHINGDRMDNRANNLRLLTREENVDMRWRKKGSRGVNFCKRSRKWLARTTLGTENRKEKKLGTFETKEEAQKAYNDYYISIKGRMW